MQKTSALHEPVLVDEVLEALRINSLALSKSQAPKYIDATLGTGGHAIKILKLGGDVLGIDEDDNLLKTAVERIEKALRAGKPSGLEACPPHLSKGKLKVGQFKSVHGNFKDINQIAKKAGFMPVDGILFDLGISSVHYKSRGRGFSFNYPDAPLDMRLNPKKQGVTAADLLNNLREDQLVDLFSIAAGISKARSLAKKVVESRKEKRFELVSDFVKLVNGGKKRQGKLNPATLPFMALRIAVNSELENLKEALGSAFSLLKPGGRLAVISFHSGEDRLVKRFFKKMKTKNFAEIINKKPITPTYKEIESNPNARSAKLRILSKK